MQNSATDMFKQIQETLEHYANQGDFVRQGITCNDEGRAKSALKLTPSLFAELERVEKGVSLDASMLKWLSATSGYIFSVKMHEATISKRQLLKLLYNIGEDADKALLEIEKRKG